MDDPHIQWLQMACAIWGGKYNLVFFRAMEALGCAAHWSMKSKIFLPLFGDLIAQETPQKWLKLSMHWNLLCIWWEVFTFQCSLLYLPITSGGNFSVPSALQPSRRVTLCFYFVPPRQESPLIVNVLLCWRL
jgi:hypothetical protein